MKQVTINDRIIESFTHTIHSYIICN